MTRVFLTSGPRGSGKTFFVRQIKQIYPYFHSINRDEILIDLFGTVYISSEFNNSKKAYNIMFDRIKKIADATNLGDNKIIILDCWNLCASERKIIIRRLEESGADRINCIQFLISTELNIVYFQRKKGFSNYPEIAIACDNELYYKESTHIEYEEFDRVYKVDQDKPGSISVRTLQSIFSSHTT